MASDSNYNIQQITNYDLPQSNSNFITAIEGVEIIKLGYCCETKGIEYPIYLKLNGIYEEIKIGQNGIYEVQSDSWIDLNDEDMFDKKETEIVITGIKVPKDIKFTLDLVTKI